MASNENNFNIIWRNYLRVQVSLDIWKPLNSKMRIKLAGSEWDWIEFKYEGLLNFCFVCGKIRHTERFCEKVFSDRSLLDNK